MFFCYQNIVKDFQAWQAHFLPGVCCLKTRSLVVCCYLHARVFQQDQCLKTGYISTVLSYKKPNKPVSADTVSNWLKNALSKSGISTSLFSTHSTRSASTSCAKAAQIPLDTIMRSARWSNYDTFQKFYNLPVVSQNNFFEIL